ncbi:MAG: questin oxidase family protein [Thaumarchaeota archaeon]|nr:questin oxidase family protein [Nitrososphaerota archaeon]
MAGTVLSYIPLLNRLVSSAAPQAIDMEPVEVHSIETAPEKRARSLKHLLRANHINHAILYHDLRFDNHTPHILCSAYLLGASDRQLNAIYEAEAKELDPWVPSPSEIVDCDWREHLGDKRFQRAFVDFFEDVLSIEHCYDWKKTVHEFMFQGEQPLANALIGGRESCPRPRPRPLASPSLSLSLSLLFLGAMT